MMGVVTDRTTSLKLHPIEERFTRPIDDMLLVCTDLLVSLLGESEHGVNSTWTN
jgi:hypothetical protein